MEVTATPGSSPSGTKASSWLPFSASWKERAPGIIFRTDSVREERASLL
ncbi:hypothetical protein [Intestinimonas butyriciproducens]|nr:hypothetical protein [Intestinimonas butyriciproducens]